MNTKYQCLIDPRILTLEQSNKIGWNLHFFTKYILQFYPCIKTNKMKIHTGLLQCYGPMSCQNSDGFLTDINEKNALECSHLMYDMSQSEHFCIKGFLFWLVKLWRSQSKLKWRLSILLSHAAASHSIRSANLAFTIVCLDSWTTFNNHLSKKVCWAMTHVSLPKQLPN